MVVGLYDCVLVLLFVSGSRELMRANRKGEPDDLLNSGIGGLGTGAPALIFLLRLVLRLVLYVGQSSSQL